MFVDGYCERAVVRLLSRHIKRYYRTRKKFCDDHGLDEGNLSRALRGKGVLTEEMVAPLGFKKKYVPVYERSPLSQEGKG